tara:strand:- start:3088 stop:3714 length:627 start_codon:yes stop_codon:yes gene_type:complete
MKISNFISFEGIDGAGKTTQIKLLKEKLESNNYKVFVFREPGGNKVNEQIREIILSKDFNITRESEMLLFLASRAELVNQVIVPLLKDNVFIICDRYVDSTLAYQGYGRNINLEFIKKLNSFVTADLLPTCTFYLDIPIDVMIERKKGEKYDRMEQSGLDFFKKVRNGYLELVKYENRIININANREIRDIELDIWEIVKSNFKGVLK